MNGRDVTIVVLNWNGWRDTLDCLESLEAADLQGASVLVVDNGSRDDSVARIREQRPAQEILALPENMGYAGGNNAGMRAALDAGAGAILLLNNDTRVAPDFLPPLLAVMRDSVRAGAVTSQILRLDRPELLDVAYLEVHFDERNVVQLQGVNRLPSEGYDARRRVYVVPGCSVLFRSEALREVGLFDEAYFAYHEDVDWCLRAAAGGWEVYYEPYSRVFHKGSRSTERFFRKPARPVWRADRAQLPHAEPMPFNPVRTYLGMRNTVRLLRRYAKPGHRVAFGLDLARQLPLETAAVVLGAESLFRLGRWSWRDVADAYLGVGVAADAAGRQRAVGQLRRLAAVPLAVGVRFPRDLISAARSGRLGEIAETLRGLRDGILNRPLPLTRLGLR